MDAAEAWYSWRHRISIWMLFFAFVFMSGWMILFRPLNSAVAFSVIDDAMYYLKVAQNVVSKGFCTYDGVTATNGFHPIWLVLLLPLYAIIHDPFMALRCVFFYVFALLAVCFLLLERISRHLRLSAAGLFVMFFVVLLNLRSFTLFYGLLESHVVLLSYLLYVLFALRAGDKRFSSAIHAFLNGMLIGVCFLARLDSFVLAIAFGIILLWRLLIKQRNWAMFLRMAVSSAAGCLLLVVHISL